MTHDESLKLRSEIAALIGTGDRFLLDDGLARLSETAGSAGERRPTFSALLSLLAHLDLSEEDAVRHWKGILENARATEARTGKEPNIYTAVVEYFTNETSIFIAPYLVEKSLFRQTEQMAMVDGLTGLFNRRYMEIMLKKEFTRCGRYRKKFSVCLIDIDDFKKVNDTRGHLFGDQVLKALADLLRSTVREEDIACRYGGEEFLIIIPETDFGGAIVLGNRIRASLKASPFFAENGITFSAGAASYPDNAHDLDSLVGAADTALYRAKFSGKDTVIAAARERRKFDRYVQAWSFSIFKERSQARPEEGTTQNISLGGIQFESAERYSQNSALHLSFTDNEDGVEADGHVAWVREDHGKYRYGVRFNDPAEVFGTKIGQVPATVRQLM